MHGVLDFVEEAVGRRVRRVWQHSFGAAGFNDLERAGVTGDLVGAAFALFAHARLEAVRRLGTTWCAVFSGRDFHRGVPEFWSNPPRDWTGG